MTRRITLAVALSAALASGAAVLAQPSPPQQPLQQEPVPPPLPPPPPPPPPGTPSPDDGVDLSVEVTISRYQGDELTSSLPYVLSMTSGPSRPGSLRMGAEVPVLTMAPPRAADGGPASVPHGGLYNYRPVGTQIDSFARSLGEGRFRVTVNINESSVYGGDATSTEAFRAPGVPVFRSFESSNTLVLRDGQSRQYTAAADRVTGESIRVDVALTVLD